MPRPHFTKQSNDPANHNGSHAGNNGTGRQHPKRDHPNLALCLIVPPSIVGTQNEERQPEFRDRCERALFGGQTRCLNGRAIEAPTRCLNLGIGRTVAASPGLCSRLRIFGHVEADQSARDPAKYRRLLVGRSPDGYGQ